MIYKNLENSYILAIVIIIMVIKPGQPGASIKTSPSYRKAVISGKGIFKPSYRAEIKALDKELKEQEPTKVESGGTQTAAADTKLSAASAEPQLAPPKTPPVDITSEQLAAAQQRRDELLARNVWNQASDLEKAGLQVRTVLSDKGFEYIGGLFTGKADVPVKEIIKRDIQQGRVESDVDTFLRGVVEGVQSPVVEAELALAGPIVGAKVAATQTGARVLGSTAAKVGGKAALGAASAYRGYEIGTAAAEGKTELAIGKSVSTAIDFGALGVGSKLGKVYQQPLKTSTRILGQEVGKQRIDIGSKDAQLVTKTGIKAGAVTKTPSGQEYISKVTTGTVKTGTSPTGAKTAQQVSKVVTRGPVGRSGFFKETTSVVPSKTGTFTGSKAIPGFKQDVRPFTQLTKTNIPTVSGSGGFTGQTSTVGVGRTTTPSGRVLDEFKFGISRIPTGPTTSTGTSGGFKTQFIKPTTTTVRPFTGTSAGQIAQNVQSIAPVVKVPGTFVPIPTKTKTRTPSYRQISTQLPPIQNQAQKTNIDVITGTQQKPMDMVGQSQITTEKTATKQDYEFGQISTPIEITSTQQSSITSTIPGIDTTTQQAQTTITEQTAPIVPAITPVITPKPVPIVPVIPLPPIGGGSNLFRPRRRSRRKKQKKKYTPSATALFFNIQAIKAPKIASGFGIRPITNKKPKKKRRRKK